MRIRDPHHPMSAAARRVRRGVAVVSAVGAGLGGFIAVAPAQPAAAATRTTVRPTFDDGNANQPQTQSAVPANCTHVTINKSEF